MPEICNRKKKWGLRSVKLFICVFLRLGKADIVQEAKQKPGGGREGGKNKYGKG